MNSKFMIARIVAWILAVGAVGAVAISYDSLPDELPVTRWTSAPKSLLLALRVPLINLLTVGLVELLSPGLHRVKNFHHADGLVSILLLTAAAKAVIEATGILLLPKPFSWTMLPLAVVLAVGLGTAAFLGRDLLESQRWKEMKMTRAETFAAATFVSAIVLLNLPLLR